jgi:hypothetical protein
MKSARRLANYLVLGVAAMLLAACSSQMQPAQQALDQISNVVEAIPVDAVQYAPEQVANVKKKLSDLNASFDKKDYAGVLASAPTVLSEAKSVSASATAKRDEAMKALAADWTELSASVPSLITSVQTRLDTLSKSHRVAKGIDLTAAKSALADATASWQRAQAASGLKHSADAVSAAKDAKTQASSAASALKMS